MKAVVKNIDKTFPLRNLDTQHDVETVIANNLQFQEDRYNANLEQAQIQSVAGIKQTQQDLQLYNNASHIIVARTLNVIGFVHIFDPLFVSVSRYEKLAQGNTGLLEKIKDLCNIVGCKGPSYPGADELLDALNRALRALYGCKLKRRETFLEIKHSEIVLEYIARKENRNAESDYEEIEM